MANYVQLSNAGDGVIMGQSSTDLISFHGATPSAQRSGSAQASVSASVSILVSTGLGYGFSTQAQADSIVTLVNEIRATLVAKGLMAGS